MKEYNHTEIPDIEAVLQEMKACADKILKTIGKDLTRSARPTLVAAIRAQSVNGFAQRDLEAIAAIQKTVPTEKFSVAIRKLHMDLLINQSSSKTLYDIFRKSFDEGPELEKITHNEDGICAMNAAAAYADIIHRATVSAGLADPFRM